MHAGGDFLARELGKGAVDSVGLAALEAHRQLARLKFEDEEECAAILDAMEPIWRWAKLSIVLASRIPFLAK